MYRQNGSELRVLIAGQEASFAHVLAANIRHWGYSAKIVPTTIPTLEIEVDCDVLIYDLDETYQLSTYLGGKDTDFSVQEHHEGMECYYSRDKDQWMRLPSVRPYLMIALSSRSVSRSTMEQLGAVALLLKPFEMGQLQQYLRVMQRLKWEGAIDTQERRAKRVLVVDDNVEVAEVIQQLVIAELGYEAEVAHDGLEALELCLDWRPTCLVTDVIMPWMNGYQIIRCLASGSLHTVPSFVIMSALAQLEEPVNHSYVPEVAITYVNKPFAIDDVLTAVEKACSECVS